MAAGSLSQALAPDLLPSPPLSEEQVVASGTCASPSFSTGYAWLHGSTITNLIAELVHKLSGTVSVCQESGCGLSWYFIRLQPGCQPGPLSHLRPECGRAFF